MDIKTIREKIEHDLNIAKQTYAMEENIYLNSGEDNSSMVWHWSGKVNALSALIFWLDEQSLSGLISDEPLNPSEIAYAKKLAQDEDGA